MYTAEVQRIHASAQGADWSSLAVWSRVATCLDMLTTQTPLSHEAQPPRKGQQLMPQTSFPQAASVSLGVENGGDHCFRIGSFMKWAVPPDSEARGRYRDHAEHDVRRREGTCCGPSNVGAAARVMMPMRRGRSR